MKNKKIYAVNCKKTQYNRKNIKFARKQISCEAGLVPLERICGRLHKLDLSHRARVPQELVQMNAKKTWTWIQL